jgi:hypothetical protein
MASSVHELRDAPRVSLFAHVVCEGSSGKCRGQTGDISTGGVFVDVLTAPFRPGELVTVLFALSAMEPPIVVEGSVSYVQSGIGVGIRFLNLAAGDRRRIEAYVEQALRGPAQRSGQHLRKSTRVAVTVPIRLWTQPDVMDASAPAEIITLSRHGACLLTGQHVDIGRRLLLETPGGRQFKGTIVWVGDPVSGNAGQVGIQCRGLAQSLGFQFP